jgi:TatA/E family protein of Tat protein translocase
MFGIGAWEMVLILVVALLVFGPKRLPELARTLGRGLAELRRASNDLRTSFDLEAADPRRMSAPDPATQPPAQTGDPLSDAASEANTSEDGADNAEETSRDETAEEAAEESSRDPREVARGGD